MERRKVQVRTAIVQLIDCRRFYIQFETDIYVWNFRNVCLLFLVKYQDIIFKYTTIINFNIE